MFFQKKVEQDTKLLALKNDIKECERLLRINKMMFDMADDDILVEVRIHELNSLNSQHKYLVNSIRNYEKEKQGV